MNVKIGDLLLHPHLGGMKVVNVSSVKTTEFIDDDWRDGFLVTADFDKPIHGVRWKNDNGDSRLIFHSYYLKNLEKK